MKLVKDVTRLMWWKLADAVRRPGNHVLEARLQYGVEHASERLALYALKRGANPDYLTYGTKIPILVAANNAMPRTIEDMLNRGANVDAKGPDQATALMCAASNGDARSVNILLAHGADVSCRCDFNNMSALDCARAYAENKPLEDLLEAAMQKAGPAPAATPTSLPGATSQSIKIRAPLKLKTGAAP
jgi:ankyrin repeat protein